MSDETAAGEAIALADPQEPPKPRAPATPAGEDGATTPGGPVMVLVGVSAFITYKVWRYRRRRAHRR
ncbi:MAG: hypothetical protein PGN27_22330 [Mycolicibacterium neoaurum]|uniref:hypothetical protein n=1 Tax=Mycolicibacterium neoaurum TaxID=1795 RepID=UPI002FF7816B